MTIDKLAYNRFGKKLNYYILLLLLQVFAGHSFCDVSDFFFFLLLFLYTYSFVLNWFVAAREQFFFLTLLHGKELRRWMKMALDAGGLSK